MRVADEKRTGLIVRIMKFVLFLHEILKPLK